jgi:membrane-bound inhibitor of C-type lysozyme
MPVEQPTVYDLAVNLTTARLIGVAIPASIRAQATLVVVANAMSASGAKRTSAMRGELVCF